MGELLTGRGATGERVEVVGVPRMPLHRDPGWIDFENEIAGSFLRHSVEGSRCSFSGPVVSAMRKQRPEGAVADAEEVQMMWSRGQHGRRR